MNLCICEDDELYRQTMCALVMDVLVENRISWQLLKELPTTEQVLEYAHHNRTPTLYFLNIDLNGELNGLEIAKEIRKNDRESSIVFIARFAGQAQLTFKYKLQALDYIVKGSDGLKSRIEDCLLIANTLLNTDETKKLKLSGKSEMTSIAFREIYFLESSNGSHRIRIHHKRGQYECRGTLKQFFAQLDARFAYCHKSFIVNKDNIRSIDLRCRKIYFENGLNCWYSKDYTKEVANWVR